MEICLLRSAITWWGGVENALYGFIKGFSSRGISVLLLTPIITNEILQKYEKYSTVVYGELIRDNDYSKIKTRYAMGELFDDSVGKRLRALVRKLAKRPEYYVLMDDLGLSVAKFKDFFPLAYWSQGAYWTLGLSYQWLNQKKSIVAFSAALASTFSLKKWSRYIEGFDLYLANSNYCKELLVYFFGRLPDGFVYPPVDTDVFKPQPPENYDYVFFAGKPSGENGIELLERIAANMPLKVAGGLKIRGAENLGYVPQDKLVSLYSGAKFTVYPTLNEPFGYIPVESMACGTPTLCLNNGGPTETVEHGKSGWVTNSEQEFLDTALNIWRHGYDQQMRKNCIKRVENAFSIDTSTNNLLLKLGLFSNYNEKSKDQIADT